MNLLLFPGVNDTEDEIECLIDFVKKNGVREIQFRNLNIDQDHYLEKIKTKGEGLGVTELIRILQQELPEVKTGNYSKPRKRKT